MTEKADQTAPVPEKPETGSPQDPVAAQPVPARAPAAKAVPAKPAAARPRPAVPRRPARPAPDDPDLSELVSKLPEVSAAQIRPRHRGLLWAFAGVVVLPLFLATAYLWIFAEDQYASTVGFTVRREEGSSASDLLGGLTRITGGGGSRETDILYEFIRSQEIVASIDERLGLNDLYSANWPGDPAFALWPGASSEQLLRHWGRMVRISYDSSSQLIELRVLAYSPEQAQLIAQEIVAESQRMINNLNRAAREDIMRYAQEDVAKTIARLKEARETLSRFRTRTQIVDPAADIQGRMGVLNNLQQQLAEALIENDIVVGSSQENDPRRAQSARRIQVIRDRIEAERATFAASEGGENYPELLAEFERITVDLQYAEETYRAALAAEDAARDQAVRQTVYLAPYIHPTLPQTAEFPQRGSLIGLLALFLTFAWAIGSLVFYSVRDRR